VIHDDIQPWNKATKFIETESSCTESAGFQPLIR
jgi:hypothetical protein